MRLRDPAQMWANLNSSALQDFGGYQSGAMQPCVVYPNELKNASAEELADFLERGQNVEQRDLRLALANALRRIATLEKQIDEMSKP